MASWLHGLLHGLAASWLDGLMAIKLDGLNLKLDGFMASWLASWLHGVVASWHASWLDGFMAS